MWKCQTHWADWLRESFNMLRLYMSVGKLSAAEGPGSSVRWSSDPLIRTLQVNKSTELLWYSVLIVHLITSAPRPLQLWLAREWRLLLHQLRPIRSSWRLQHQGKHWYPIRQLRLQARRSPEGRVRHQRPSRSGSVLRRLRTWWLQQWIILR